jgi:hypothetical protein
MPGSAHLPQHAIGEWVEPIYIKRGSPKWKHARSARKLMGFFGPFPEK